MPSPSKGTESNVLSEILFHNKMIIMVFRGVCSQASWLSESEGGWVAKVNVIGRTVEEALKTNKPQPKQKNRTNG